MADECEYISTNVQTTFDQIIPYFWFLLGVPGHIILIREFYKQSKTDRAYSYQIILTVSKLVEIFIGSVSTLIISMTNEVGIMALKKSYIIQFYNAHMYLPVWQGTGLISLFLTVLLTADRLFAVAKPLIYRNLNHKAIQKVAVLICFLLSVTLNISDGWVWQVVQVSDMNSTDVYYNLGWPEDGPSNTSGATIFSHIRTGLRLMAVVILIVSNVILMIALRRRTKKLKQITLTNEEEQKRRAMADRTLLIMAICQSIFTLVNHVPTAIDSILLLAAPSFTICYNGIIAPLVGASTQFSSVIDFLVLVMVQKKIRDRFLHLLKWKWKCVSKKPTPTVAQNVVQNVAVRQSDQGNSRRAWE